MDFIEECQKRKLPSRVKREVDDLSRMTILPRPCLRPEPRQPNPRRSGVLEVNKLHSGEQAVDTGVLEHPTTVGGGCGLLEVGTFARSPPNAIYLQLDWSVTH